MIQANHSRLSEALFSIYLKRLFQKQFSAFRIINDFPEEAREGGPVLLLPNHSSWWDGFVFFLHNRLELRKNFFLMMLERELKRNKFFSRLGAFSIDPSLPRKTLESLRYSLDVLENGGSDTGLILFPQGEILLSESRNYHFRPGVGWIFSRLSRPVNVVAAQIRLLFRGEQYPELNLGYTFLGKSKVSRSEDQSSWYEERFIRAQEAFDQKLSAGEKGRLLLRGRKSINESFSLP